MTTKMKNAAYTQTLRNLLENVNGSTFISLDTITPVKLTGGKSNPLQGRVTKKTTGSNVMVFQNKKGSNSYSNMVNRRLEREGKIPTFEVGPRTWGTRIPETPFIQHNDELYLEMIFLNSGKSEYLLDGKTFSDEIEGLISEDVSAIGDGIWAAQTDQKEVHIEIICPPSSSDTVTQHLFINLIGKLHD